MSAGFGASSVLGVSAAFGASAGECQFRKAAAAALVMAMATAGSAVAAVGVPVVPVVCGPLGIAPSGLAMLAAAFTSLFV